MKSLPSPVAVKRAAALSSLLLTASCLIYVSARPGPSRPAPRHMPATAERRAHETKPARAPSTAVAKRAPTAAPKSPIDFIENRGQWDARAAFMARAGGMRAAFEKGAVRLRLGKERPAQLALNFEGSSARATVAGEGARAGRYNFFVGSDPGKWRSNVATFAAVLYRGLYDGVDMRVREEGGRLEYDLIVAPGADLEKVVIRADGASRLDLTDDGSLVLRTASGELRQTPPRTWEQLPSGERRPVECRFRKIDARRYGFVAQRRDRSLPLVIDPGLEWSTYVGGGEWDEIHDLAAAGDGTGDVIAVGATLSDDFSNRPNPVAGFVTRFSATGTLVYKTILGGSDREWVHGLAVAAGGEPVVVGESYSPDYPVTAGAYDTTHGFKTDALGAIYHADAFVTRLNAAGQIAFSTFVGGNDYDLAYAVALAPNGTVVLAGETMSTDWPTTAGAYDRTHNCCTPYFSGVFSRLDAFVARLSADGSALEYSTYFGGHGDEPPESVVVDAEGFVTLTGLTYSPPGGGPHLPTTADALSRTPFNVESNPDAYLARFRPDGGGAADLRYSTFLGGGNTDAGYAVALDPANANDVIVGGVTYSTAGVPAIFPTTPGTIKPNSTSIDGFLMRFRFPEGTGGSLVWSTFYGGLDYEEISDIAVRPDGEIVIAGQTRSFDLPTTQGAFDRTVAISSGVPFFDAFAARVSADGARVLYGSYLGGSFNERFMNLALVGPNSAAVSGWTNSGDFPVTPGAHDPVLNNDGVGGPGGGPGGIPFDGFIARLTIQPDGDGDDSVVTPALLGPANGAQLATNTPTTFDWSDVPDPAGIDGYQFQINQRPDFVCCNDWHEVWVPNSQYVASVRFEGPYYWRVRAADRSGNLSDWSEVRSFNSGTTVSTLTLNPDSVAGGNSAQGQVTLTAAALPGGMTITLSSSDPAVATVPASVNIPQGSSFATFAVSTRAVSAPTAVTITASHGGNTRSATLAVTPTTAAPAAPTLVSPASGARVPLDASVTFSWNGAAGAATYEIQIDDSDRFSAPLVASQGGLTQTQYAAIFKAEKRCWWRVRGRTAGGTNGAWSSVRSFEVRRGASQPPPPSPAALSSLSLSPTTVTGGNISKGTVTLTSAAPSGGAVVALSSSNASVAAVPASVAVPAGTTSAAFNVTTSAVTASTSVTVSASYNGVNRTASLAVQPAPTTPTVSLSSLALSPTGVTGGGTSRGTVTLSGPAPSGGASVALSSSNAGVAAVPASVAVPAGATSVTFNATTNSVTASTAVTISASYGGVTRTATLTVGPAQAGDTVAIQIAEYTSDKRELRIEATSTNGSAVLRCYVSSTGALIGTLTNDGGGRYRGQFSWPTNPQSVTVRSSLGGSATRSVAAR